MRYFLKPKVVEAFIWTGRPDQTEDPEWIVEAIKAGMVSFSKDPLLMHISQKPNGRILTAHPGDYIINGILGNIFPLNAKSFHDTYEVLEDKR